MTAQPVRRPRDRRAAIVSAAARLFASKGFSGAGIDEIAAEVGVTGPALYRHFKNKDALLETVVLSTIEMFRQAVEDAAPSVPLEDIVAEMVRVALDRPTLIATYVRERHRITGSARSDLESAERDLYVPWMAACRRSNPDVNERDLDVRQVAVMSAMSTAVTRRPLLSRPELDQLLAGAMTSVLQAPPAQAVTDPALRQGGWSAPTTRREEVLTNALRMFRDRGFQGVGIDEIGAAAGITGPTVYFHYENKSAILVDAFDRAGSRVMAGVHDALSKSESAVEALQRLTDSYSEIAADNVDLIVVTSREGWALPPEERPRLSRRRREIQEAWCAIVYEVCPGLNEGALRTLVTAAFPLVTRLIQRGADHREAARLARVWLTGRQI